MKKLNKFFAVLVALAMMATLCVMSAFAADNANGKEANADGKQSAAAVVSKYLKVNEGTTVPDATFTYQFTAVASDTNDGGPAIADYVWNTKGENKNMNATPAADGNAVAGSVTIASLVTNGENLIFDAPGEYIYVMKEKSGVLNDTAEEGITTKLTNDTTSEYTIRIYVKYDGNKLVIDTITITNPAGEKVDPTETPVTDEQFDPDDAQKDKGGTIVNTYEKSETVKPEDLTEATAIMSLKKLVPENAYVSADQAFPFTVTVTAPEDNTMTDIEAYIISGESKTKVDDFAFGSNIINLKAGEVLAVSKAPYGTKYLVKEDLTKTAGTPAAEVVVNHANFTPTYAWTDDDTEVTGGGAAYKGQDLQLSSTGLIADTDAANSVVYTNTFDSSDVTPTGILMNNLPYIVLALVAIGGLVAYVVVRRRNADEA